MSKQLTNQQAHSPQPNTLSAPLSRPLTRRPQHSLVFVFSPRKLVNPQPPLTAPESSDGEEEWKDDTDIEIGSMRAHTNRSDDHSAEESKVSHTHTHTHTHEYTHAQLSGTDDGRLIG